MSDASDEQSNSQQDSKYASKVLFQCNMLILCIDFCTKWIFPAIYFIMSFISCQWIRPKRKNESDSCSCFMFNFVPICHYKTLSHIIGIVMVFISILAVAINIFPLVMFIIGWAECPYTHSSICYTLQFHFEENKSIPKLILRDIPKGITQSNQ